MCNKKFSITHEGSLFKDDCRDGVRSDFVRLPGGLLYGELGLKRRFGWVCIESACGKVYRQALGAPETELNPVPEKYAYLLADYDTIQELRCEVDGNPEYCGTITKAATDEENALYSVRWTVRKVSGIEKPLALWNHPDSGYRVSVRIALTSALVGLVSLIVGILGFVTGL